MAISWSSGSIVYNSANSQGAFTQSISGGTVTVTGTEAVKVKAYKQFNFGNNATAVLTIAGQGTLTANAPGNGSVQEATSSELLLPAGTFPYTLESHLTVYGTHTSGQAQAEAIQGTSTPVPVAPTPVAPTPVAPTPTATGQCYYYQLEANGADVIFTYTDCTGSGQSVTVVDGQLSLVCAQLGTVLQNNNSGSITIGTSCGTAPTPVAPTPVPVAPTPVPVAPTPAPTSSAPTPVSTTGLTICLTSVQQDAGPDLSFYNSATDAANYTNAFYTLTNIDQYTASIQANGQYCFTVTSGYPTSGTVYAVSTNGGGAAPCTLVNSYAIATTPTPVAPTPSPVAPTPVAPTPVAPTPVAPTPVAPTPVSVVCYFYDVTSDGGSTVQFSYQNCAGVASSVTVPLGDSTQICAREGTVQMSPNDGTIVQSLVTCSGAPTPSPVAPTPVPVAPTPAPVGGGNNSGQGSTG